jgi:hypothetical protein
MMQVRKALLVCAKLMANQEGCTVSMTACSLSYRKSSDLRFAALFAGSESTRAPYVARQRSITLLCFFSGCARVSTGYAFKCNGFQIPLQRLRIATDTLHQAVRVKRPARLDAAFLHLT